ncbi:MAG: hypothetical protein HY958_12950 [Bacteroidia bacterium]|nr:hypothetical protein [Bacteroidia bacterium]
MAGFFKKALGVFVEFDENAETAEKQSVSPQVTSRQPVTYEKRLNAEDVDKFAKHFESLFDQANLPGPDYFEFWKMMETLEKHIADENARISATFAALSVQGLTKEKLIETANQYKLVIQNDRTNFEKALNDAGRNEIELRQKKLKDLELLIQKNSEMIQKLTKEITESQGMTARLKVEVQEEENKFSKNKNGYLIACEAVLNKITTDIQKIQTNL